MNSRMRMTAVFIALLVIPTACESVALMPRPDIDARTVGRNRLERTPDSARSDRESSRVAERGEITGTVQRIDITRREIYLRTPERNLLTFGYDPNAVVYDRDRDVPVEELRSGDEIAVRPRVNASTEHYADVIRMVNRKPDVSAGREY
jgi:hypothetical protein